MNTQLRESAVGNMLAPTHANDCHRPQWRLQLWQDEYRPRDAGDLAVTADPRIARRVHGCF